MRLAMRDQEHAGIDIVSDGEQSRRHFVTTFIEHLEGVDFEHKRPCASGSATTPRCRSRRSGRAARTRCSSRTCVPARRDDAQDQVHAARSDDDGRHALRRALQEPREAREGVRGDPQRGGARDRGTGVDVIQFDEPAFNVYFDEVSDWGMEALERARRASMQDRRAHLLRLRDQGQHRLEEDARANGGSTNRPSRCSRARDRPGLARMRELARADRAARPARGQGRAGRRDRRRHRKGRDAGGSRRHHPHGAEVCPAERLYPCTNCGMVPLPGTSRGASSGHSGRARRSCARSSAPPADRRGAPTASGCRPAR